MNPCRLAAAIAPLLTLLVAACGAPGAPLEPTSVAPPEPGSYEPRLRRYFVAAEEVTWSYAPSGENQIRPKMGLGPWGERLAYPKVRYVQYTDETFAERVPQPEHRGILGPMLRAVVGDTLEVTFLNRATSGVYSMHPHGVRYAKEHEGASYAGFVGPGHAVAPGERFTYRWEVPESAGPGPRDPSSVVWLYHSHVDSLADPQRGLIGSIVVTDPARARDDGSPEDVDRELTALFLIFDENEAGEEEEGDLMHAINGRIFGNLPGLDLVEGERVRWYLLGLGNEVDLHTPHWHGETVVYDGRHTDTIELLPASMKVVDMVADNPGTWVFHCHVSDHIAAGMLSLFHIEPSRAGQPE